MTEASNWVLSMLHLVQVSNLFLKFIFDFKQGKEKLEKEKIIIEAKISSYSQFSNDKGNIFFIFVITTSIHTWEQFQIVH